MFSWFNDFADTKVIQYIAHIKENKQKIRLSKYTLTRLFWSAKYLTTMGNKYLENAKGMEGLFSWQKMAI